MKNELEFDESDPKNIEDINDVDDADEDVCEDVVDENNVDIAGMTDSIVNSVIENSSLCPECHAPIIHEGGCDICKNCGYSKCQ